MQFFLGKQADITFRTLSNDLPPLTEKEFDLKHHYLRKLFTSHIKVFPDNLCMFIIIEFPLLLFIPLIWTSSSLAERLLVCNWCSAATGGAGSWRYLVGAELLYQLNPTFLLGTILNEQWTETETERECVLSVLYYWKILYSYTEFLSWTQ